ncbi:glycosyltransferase family 4 protein [Bradyrhizobium sp.]|uniref:glycosyltransferase family 4 protein n=1 Tax=Bradyrhizobium sp. TaxID=376 RepID=UPI0026019A13|nr:glycosyltransferase family 4 protein [Bradyrhizobium sp.]
MKLLFCCAEYWPSVGGVQEVIRQIAEQMVKAGHDVTVATSAHSARTAEFHNGVRIQEFRVEGNLAVGMVGEVDRYRSFVRNFEGDAVLIKAAQQWSFDALWPVLDSLKLRKVFIPCGFSGLYEPIYADYFARMPEILRKFDHLIFYSGKYRDIDFAKAHGIIDYSIIPNGANETEFGRVADGTLRARLGIPPDDFVFLTVGSPIEGKGHKEVGQAFAQMDAGSRNVALILNGRSSEPRQRPLLAILGFLLRPRVWRKGVEFLSREGWQGVWKRLFPRRSPVPEMHLDKTVVKSGDLRAGTKRVLHVDLPREDVVSAFLEADLFVFASKVEYSPLVLFESAAAGTPFVTVPVGNSGEIVRWSGGGWICPAEVDERGYTNVSPDVLARELEKAVRSPDFLHKLGEAGHLAWQERFTWTTIGRSYERVLRGETVMSPMMSETVEAPARG